jgi:hypothetical protein
MIPSSPPITSSTGKVDPQLAAFLATLTPGERIRILQRVRVGAHIWSAPVEGVFRGIDYLATGLATDRVKEDDIVVPVVHFTKANGELSSITLDEHSKVERV